VDIASTGFRLPYYSISCEQQTEQLNGAGLHLAPAEAVDVGLSTGSGPEHDVPMAGRPTGRAGRSDRDVSRRRGMTVTVRA
jgi:hypothetical protein